MSEQFDPSATQALKKQDPIWYRIRSVMTLQVVGWLLVATITGIIAIFVQFRLLRTDLTAALTGMQAAQTQGERIAALEQAVKDMKERFDRFDKAVETPDPRIKRRAH